MKTVTIEDQAVFEEYYRRFPQTICEYTFAQMLLWGESRQHKWTEHEGHLLVSFQKREESEMWYEPIGPNPEKIIAAFPERKWFYISESTAQKFPAAIETPERFDYIYSVQALRELKGSAYAEKRNFINRAKKFNPEVVQLSSSMTGECQKMLEDWMNKEPREGMQSLLDEISSLRIAMENFEKLGLFGVGIRIDGKLEAFSFGVEMNPTMFVEYFQKSTNEHPGLYPLVLNELTKALPKKYEEINLEEDLGLPGLRTAKERWEPIYQVKKYKVDSK